MSLLVACVKGIDALTERVGRLTAWVTVLLVLLVVYDVVMRYSFQVTTAAMVELEWHLFSLIFLLGASYALKHDKHVRVDVFYHRWSPKRQSWINLLGQLLFVIPFSAVWLRSSLRFAQNSYIIRETSPNPDGLPAWYLIKAVMVLAALLLLLQSIAELLRQGLRISGRLPFPDKPEAHA